MTEITYDKVMAELARRDYSEYVEYVHDGRYKHGRFTRFLSRTVQEFVEAETGHAYDILLLSVPPQHGKSMTITETLPSWYMGRHPEAPVVIISWGEEFAQLFARRNREKIVLYGQQIFGIRIGDKDTAIEFDVAGHRGSLISRGVTSGLAGRPCKLMIIDDPIKNMETAMSESQREKIFDEYVNGYKTRLAPGAKIIIIQTRWHKQDLYGKVLEIEHNVTRLNFPVECETETDILGRKFGDPLCPEIGKDKAWLADYKRTFVNQAGSRAWNALYRGQPTDEEGGIFKRQWAKYYRVAPEIGFKIISVDASFKDNDKNDPVAIHVWGKTGTDYFLLDRNPSGQRLGFVDTVGALNEFIYRHPDYKAIYIEDKANGSAIIDVLRRRYSAVIPVNPEGGKEARAYAVSPLWEAGNVYFKEGRDDDIVNECVDFPNADHDDHVDCMDQALNQLRNIIATPPTRDPDRWNEDDQIDSILSWKG